MSTTYYAEVEVHDVSAALRSKVIRATRAWYDGSCSHVDDLDYIPLSGWTECFYEGGTQREHDELVATIAEVAPGARVVTRWFCWDHVQWDNVYGETDADADPDE